MLAYFLFFLLYMVVPIYGPQVLNGVLEEKDTRIVEVLLAIVKTIELMVGKMAGIGLAGLTQIAVWMATMLVLSAPGVLGAMALGGGCRIPSVTPWVFVHFLLLFLVGFLMCASLYASIGAAFNNPQEAQQFASIPMVVMIACCSSHVPVLNDPNSTLSVVTLAHPVLHPDADGAAHRDPDAAALADPRSATCSAGFRRLPGLGLRPDLPGGDPDVRQEADLRRRSGAGSATHERSAGPTLRSRARARATCEATQSTGGGPGRAGTGAAEALAQVGSRPRLAHGLPGQLLGVGEGRLEVAVELLARRLELAPQAVDLDRLGADLGGVGVGAVEQRAQLLVAGAHLVAHRLGGGERVGAQPFEGGALLGAQLERVGDPLGAHLEPFLGPFRVAGGRCGRPGPAEGGQGRQAPAAIPARVPDG